MGARERKTILVVEDEEKIAAVLASQFRLAGYDVHTETHGRPALRYAVEHEPDLAILDLRLPDMDGYDLCKALRTVYSPWNLPVLMLTALNQPIDQLRGFAHGANAYMTKPFELTEVVETAAQLLEHTASA